MEELSPSRKMKPGRRAGNNSLQATQSSSSTESENQSITPKPPTRKQGGWADNVERKRGGGEDGKGRNREQIEEDDERLKHDTTVLLDNDADDIPVIPDLDEIKEEDSECDVAAPPSVQVTRVATYKELDYDFEKHAGLLNLDGDIDLKLLGSVLAPEADVFEEDKVWEWDRIFTEVASDLRTEWEKTRNIVEKSQ